MSNWKHAYGWSGHILVDEACCGGNPDNNVIAIASDKFHRLTNEHDNCQLDSRVCVQQLGFTADHEMQFMAIGHPITFSEGFEFYGTVFTEADLRASPGPNATDPDGEYLEAMRTVYGLNLPPCKLMVGCSSEY